MKKFLSLIMVLVMMFTLSIGTASAASKSVKATVGGISLNTGERYSATANVKFSVSNLNKGEQYHVVVEATNGKYTAKYDHPTFTASKTSFSGTVSGAIPKGTYKVKVYVKDNTGKIVATSSAKTVKVYQCLYCSKTGAYAQIYEHLVDSKEYRKDPICALYEDVGTILKIIGKKMAGLI